MSFGDSGLLAVMALLALFGFMSMLLRRSHRQLLNRDRDKPMFTATTPGRRERAPLPDAPREVVDWEVKMHDTARELSAQLDSKMSALQQLILDADRAAARLERVLGGASPPGESVVPADNPAPAPAVPAGPPQPDQIYVLSDYGFAPAEIARRVDLPVSEVNRLLELRPRESP